MFCHVLRRVENYFGVVSRQQQRASVDEAYGECLGMAFQSLSSDSAENIGYVIPTVVIRANLSLDPVVLHILYTLDKMIQVGHHDGPRNGCPSIF